MSEVFIVINAIQTALAATVLYHCKYLTLRSNSFLQNRPLVLTEQLRLGSAPQTLKNHQAKVGVIYCRQLSFPKGFHCQEFSPNQCYQSHL